MSNPIEKQIKFIMSFHDRLEKRLSGSELNEEFYAHLDEMISQGVVSSAVKDVAMAIYGNVPIDYKKLSSAVKKKSSSSSSSSYGGGCTGGGYSRSGC